MNPVKSKRELVQSFVFSPPPFSHGRKLINHSMKNMKTIENMKQFNLHQYKGSLPDVFNCLAFNHQDKLTDYTCVLFGMIIKVV